MTHASENVRRLESSTIQVDDLKQLRQLELPTSAAWLFVLPNNLLSHPPQEWAKWTDQLVEFATTLAKQSIVAVLTSPQCAAESLPRLLQVLKLQLWVAVKQRQPEQDAMQLVTNHAALLILSRYPGSLVHTKTRIAYSYCPTCEKTTKDYGGKKHTYHQYGTLMSDVWRDIQLEPNERPDAVIDRLADLFGLPDFTYLQVVELRAPIASKTKSRLRTAASATTGQETSIGSQLIQGDSLAELRKLPANSIEFCFADPPYNLDKRYDSWDDALDATEYLRWCGEWINELARVVRPGGTCAILNIPALATEHYHQLKTAGLTFQNWIVWEGLSLPVRMIMPAHYSIVCFSKGIPRNLPGTQSKRTPRDQASLHALKALYCVRQSCIKFRRTARVPDRQPITDLWWDIHRLKHNSRRVDHPCQLPPDLMFRLIALFTNPDEVVLDPFNGAGTTSLCAASMGRKFIGIELSNKYHKLAVERHRLFSDGGNPFGKGDHVPKAKNSRVKRIGGVKYEVPKKTLQLEVKRIAEVLQRLPTRQDVEQFGKYPIQMFDEYFINWGEVCAAARTTGMTETRTASPVTTNSQQDSLFNS